MEHENLTTWRKASYSDNGGNCIEVASAGHVAIRDTTDRQGTVLVVSASAWQEFLSRVR